MTLSLRTHIFVAGLLGSAVLFAVPPGANAGQILGAPTYIGLGSGLVGYWSFNGGDVVVDNTGGMRAYDRSGNGNHSNRSTAANAPARIPGKIGQALDYVGDSSDVIAVPQSSSLNNMSQVSGSLWLYTRNTLDFNSILNKWADNTQVDGWGLEDCGCGRDDLGFEAGFNTNSFFIETTSVPLKRNSWQHIAFTWGGAGDGSDFKFYVDGVLVTSTNVVSTGSNGRVSDAGETLKIGNNDTGGSGWDGSFDEVRVYNRILTADEIKRLYKIGNTLRQGAPNSTGSLSQGLVGWWTMDGADILIDGDSVVTALDRSGIDRHASSSPQTPPKKAIGKIGQGLEFDSSVNLLSAGKPSVFNNMTEKTVCSWIKPTSFATRDIVGKWDTGEFGGWTFRIDSACATGQDLCYYHNFFPTNGRWSTSGGITLNAWNHACMSYSTSDLNDPIFYINGTSRAVTEVVEPSGTSRDESTASLVIGNISENAADSSFGGTIDDVRIWNRILSADEIKRLYNIGGTLHTGVASANGSLSNGLTGWWTFDGNDTAKNGSGLLSVLDRSGSGNRATSPSAAATPVTNFGTLGQGLQFDGSNDILNVTAMTPHTFNDFSLAAWIKTRVTSSADDYDVFSDWNNAQTSGVEFGTTDDPGQADRLRLELCNACGGVTDYYGTSDIVDGQWHHAAVVRVGTRIKLYVDGALESDTADAQSGAIAITSSTWSGPGIGNKNDDPTANNRMDGSLDDVRFYDRALTADEVKRLYNMGR